MPNLDVFRALPRPLHMIWKKSVAVFGEPCQWWAWHPAQAIRSISFAALYPILGKSVFPQKRHFFRCALLEDLWSWNYGCGTSWRLWECVKYSNTAVRPHDPVDVQVDLASHKTCCFTMKEKRPKHNDKQKTIASTIIDNKSTQGSHNKIKRKRKKQSRIWGLKTCMISFGKKWKWDYSIKQMRTINNF